MSLVDDIKAIQRAVGVTTDGVFGPMTAQAVLTELSSRAGIERDADPVTLDERTMRNIGTLDEKARELFMQFSLLAKATAATFGCDYVMISGNRSWDEQNALYAQGRTAPGAKVTNARGGYSNHNFRIAGDYGVFRGKVYLDDTDEALAAKVHAACAVHARKLGMEWGGDWKKIKDFPHYEIRTGLTMAEKRELYREKGSVL